MKQLVTITVKATEELGVAVSNLRHFNDPESIRNPTLAVHTLENEADVVYRRAIEALFSNGMDAREIVPAKGHALLAGRRRRSSARMPWT